MSNNDVPQYVYAESTLMDAWELVKRESEKLQRLIDNESTPDHLDVTEGYL